MDQYSYYNSHPSIVSWLAQLVEHETSNLKVMGLRLLSDDFFLLILPVKLTQSSESDFAVSC